MATQWRVGFGGAIGLDYSVIETVARLIGVRLKKATFEGLQLMESEALKVFAEQSKT